MAKKKRLKPLAKKPNRTRRKGASTSPASDPPSSKSSAQSRSIGQQELAEVTNPTASKPGFAVVGIGASAGGLEAFKRFLSAMPEEAGMAFVLIQHLDPTHESLTSEILAKHTKMPVIQATDGVPIQPDHVYVIPPNQYLAISGEKLHLTVPFERRGMRVPIDFFFRSLADDQRERAIGILLSGTGSDGTNGVREIKASGGMVMVQSPETTQWEGMLRSAIATGVVDHVLPIEKMPEVLTRYVKHWYVNGALPAQPPVEKAPDYLSQIIGLLRARCKYDFSRYKQGTLTRRIQRRMGLNHIEKMRDYVDYVKDRQSEVNALFKDMLISVTSFFREPKAWEELERQVIVPLVRDRGLEGSIRAWVPGCATGEEAYSVAMMILDQCNKQDKVVDLHVFASDIDRDALGFARAGVYPESVAADVPPAMLRRYFIKGEHTYRVCKELRETVVFAEQNVISDPPFSKLDLISCRNLLIYLEAEVQSKVLGLFHFALHNGGVLFLGSSETVGSGGLFHALSRRMRIYRRLPSGRHEHLELPMQPASTDEKPAPRDEPAHKGGDGRLRRLSHVAQQLILQRFAPACAIINRNCEALYLHGAVDRYLQLPLGELAPDITAMARDGLRTKLRAAVHQAIRDNKRVTVPQISVKRDHEYVSARLTVEPLGSDKEAGLLLIVFDGPDQPAAAAVAARPARQEPARHAPATENEYEVIIAQLEERLRSTREDLQSTIEQLETSNEEFKAANEEVTSVNEELQSTNEELETSKEELQSLNEEMQTVNHQLEQKIGELESTNNDLNNLLASGEIATLLLDRQFRIKRFTQASTRLLRVRDSDVGRPIGDFAQNFTDEELLKDAQQVLETFNSVHKEVRDRDGRTYSRRIVPYRTEDDRVDGVVISFSDVTDRKERERVLERYNQELEDEVARRTDQVDFQTRELSNLGEQERQRVGRELHDTLGQQITAIGMLAASLKSQTGLSSAQQALAEKLETSVDELKSHIRVLSKGLFPVDVDAQGLPVALDELAHEISSVFPVICRFEGSDGLVMHDNFQATQLFLIAREAAHNAARHAKAGQIKIRLHDTDGVTLTVEDDGRGLPVHWDDKAGMGVRIIRHRAGLIGGELKFESSDGQGTRLTCHCSKAEK